MTRRTILFLALLAAVSFGAYLLTSHLTYRIGFPLDDAWIHQTYARNLAQRGEWAFLPGQPSAGSTGPLWAVLLAPGHIFGLGPYLWSYFLGWLLLAGLGILAVLLFQRLSPDHQRWAPWAGVLLILEWHLIWAAGSGMETLLFAFLAAFSMLSLVGIETQAENKKSHWLFVGMLIGLSVWVRPGGITLLAPAILVSLVSSITSSDKFKNVLFLTLGFLFLFVPYLFFNLSIADAWWPNTFYAKQAEYASHRQFSLWRRWLQQVSLPLIGIGIVLLPGWLFHLVKSIRRRYWSSIAGSLWTIGYISMYACRLPVTYQHGRYLIPIMPIFFLWGFAGLVEFMEEYKIAQYQRIAGRVWVITTAALLFLFYGLGAQAYGRDVAIIETEMVTIAHWIAENTPQDSLIAAHDIGALGYFADRSLLDLAGLVSPDVIPFIRDQARLETYMLTQGADYLVTFPSWYPEITVGASPEFQTDSPFSRLTNHENMAVYPLPIP